VRAGVPEVTADALTAISEAEENGEAPPEWANDHMVAIYQERAEMGWSNPVYTFTSVPKAYWWSIVTLTTTGYGDMFPVTLGGRIVAGGTMLAGLGLFSLLTSVVGRALMTTLFGSNDEKAPTNRIVVIGGGRLPAGTDVRSLVGLDPHAHEAHATPRGGLEGVLMETDIKLRDIAQSVGHVADDVVRAASQGAVDSATAIRREQAGVVDRLVYSAFADPTSKLYMPTQQFLTALIFASVVLVVADSIREVHEAYHVWFEWIEKVIVLCFTIEFVANYRLAPNKRKYVFSMWGMVDLLAILPTYIDLGIGLLALLGVQMHLSGGLLFKVLRMMRVLRMLRTLKLAKTAAANMEQAMSKKGGSSFSANLQIYFIALFTVLIISSTLMWNVEYDPLDKNSTTMFINIPAAMWWGIVTLCTVGYGDMFPVTFAGRAIAGATMLCGLALFGILTSVIGTALMASLFGSSDDDAEPEIIYLDAPEGSDTPVIDSLERLAALRSAGALTDEDFERAKLVALSPS
jgi:voltage-gated potassium channel Kch